MTPTPADHPKHSRGPLSLLLPVHNAAGKLPAAVDAWRQVLDKSGRDYDILVIDDGSTDVTAADALAAAAKHPVVRSVRHEVRRGVGACLRTGLSETTHPNIAYAGPGYNPADIPALVEQLDQADLVSGCRAGAMPRWLRTLDTVWRVAVRVLFGVALESRTAWRGWADWRRVKRLRWQFGVRIDDPLCDFKAFRRDALGRVTLQSDGDFAHAELVAKANFLGCMMAQVPVAPPVRPDQPVDEREYAAERRRVFGRPAFLPFPGVAGEGG